MAVHSIITDLDSWARAGRGRSLQFFCTDAEMQDWLNTCLPARYSPYHLVGVDKVREGHAYVDRTFGCEVSDLLQCMQGSVGERWQFWIWSDKLTPGLHLYLPRSERPDVLCSLNGLVLVQHGLRRGNLRDASAIGINDQVENSLTGELREHAGYLELFKALRKAIEKSLCYATIQRFRDGHEEEDARVRRMTMEAARAYQAGYPFANSPGRLLERRGGLDR
jgi:hypothetical protein